MALVFSSLFVILALWFTLLNMGNVTSLFKNNNRGDLYLLNFTQKLDHFDTKSGLSNFTFQQRLLVNDSQWNGPKPCVSPPIFAYLGGVDEKLVDPGQYDVLSSFAVEFKGILISIEHRFTGGSIPLDSFDLAMANSSIKASLTIDNVLQDFADIIQSLKANYSAKNAPVIVVGTGYGGALAAWFRMKYPHIAIGAHATSTLTPLLHYYGTDLWCRFVSNNTKSFQNKGFWMPKDGGCLTDGEITYDSNSRIEPKRPHQWFVDGGEAGFLPIKKQALEVPGSNSFAGIPASSLSPWGSMSGFNSVPSQFTEQLFDTDATRSISFDERNIASDSMGSLNAGRKDLGDPFGKNSSFGLSMSHSLEDPKSGINFGGIRKVKVSEVRDPENLMPLSEGPSYTRESISTAHGYGKVDDSEISMGLTYGREENNVVTAGDSYGRGDDSFISMGQSFDKDSCNTMTMGHSYKADCSPMPMANSFSEATCNIIPVAENFSKGDNNVISMGSLSQGDKMISVSHPYKGDSSMSVTNNDESTTLFAPSNNKCESHALSMGNSLNKGDSNIISFGGYNDDDDDANASGRLFCSYDLLMGQSSIQRPDTLKQKNVTVSNADAAIVAAAQAIASGAESASKKKEDSKSTKKTPPNNFPSNVRSLLSTGILDEVPVKYIAWSREKELRGIIKGSGYLCGCKSCNFSKAINAYEFERHAGSKTKHPNNHIYFENGKTIYGIVQELRNTPQNMLFDVIQTITGSPINQKSFRLWKESFLAATRELQRIYGKDERNQSI